jgi:hypothetical protein
MRKLTLGLVAAATLAMVVPAAAEDFYVGVPGVGVGVGHHRYRDHDWDRYHYRRTEGFEGRSVERCRTVTIRHADGTVTRDRRCRD